MWIMVSMWKWEVPINVWDWSQRSVEKMGFWEWSTICCYEIDPLGYWDLSQNSIFRLENFASDPRGINFWFLDSIPALKKCCSGITTWFWTLGFIQKPHFSDAWISPKPRSEPFILISRFLFKNIYIYVHYMNIRKHLSKFLDK